MLRQLLVALVLFVSANAFAGGYWSGPEVDSTVIDGASAKSLSSIQTQMQKDFMFPNNYDKTFKSLSALLIDGHWNYSTVIREIHVVNMAQLRMTLGDQPFHALMDTMINAAAANKNVHLLFNADAD